MVLHETGVADAVVGGVDSDTALGLLHDDCEDEAVVDLGGLGDGFDSGFDDGVLFVGVVGDGELRAGGLHEGLVGFEHLVVGYPVRLRGPACAGGAVTVVHLVGVAAGALAVVVVDGGDGEWAADGAFDADGCGGPVT